jgi:hypothetical protein
VNRILEPMHRYVRVLDEYVEGNMRALDSGEEELREIFTPQTLIGTCSNRRC